MKKTTNIFRMVVLLAVLGSLTVNVYGSQSEDRGIYFTFEPEEIPEKAGPVNMKFGFSLNHEFCDGCKCCDEVQVEVIGKRGLQYHGITPLVATLSQDSSHSYSTMLSITVPPNDTSSIDIYVTVGKSRVSTVGYFVTTGELVEFWNGYPSGRYWKTPKWVPDTALYEIRVDMRNSIWRSDTHMARLFEDEYGKLIETKDTGFFILKLPRGGLESLKRAKIKCEYIVEPPPWPAAPPRSHDRVIKRKSDSTN